MMLAGLILFICCFIFALANNVNSNNEITHTFTDTYFNYSSDIFSTGNNKSYESKVIYVEKDQILTVILGNTYYESYHWSLDNETQIKYSKDIELLESSTDSHGNCIFKFHIKNTATSSSDMKLKFKETIGLRTKFSYDLIPMFKEKHLSDVVSIYDININELKNNEPIEVESNSLVNIIVTGGGVIGWTRIEFDAEAIESSKVIEYLGDFYRDNPDLCHCDPIENICTCIDDVVSKFYIKEPKNGVTPKLKFTRNSTELFHIEVPVIIKPKKCPSSEYKCCSHDDATVRYHDEEGDWGIENKEWCLINRPKVIRVCEANLSGIACREDVDMDIRNIHNEQLVIRPSVTEVYAKYYCFYTGHYPICKKTTEVVYTDTEKWGIENDEWCVMCH